MPKTKGNQVGIMKKITNNEVDEWIKFKVETTEGYEDMIDTSCKNTMLTDIKDYFQIPDDEEIEFEVSDWFNMVGQRLDEEFQKIIVDKNLGEW